jgi:hypothetical protein
MRRAILLLPVHAFMAWIEGIFYLLAPFISRLTCLRLFIIFLSYPKNQTTAVTFHIVPYLLFAILGSRVAI